MAHKLPSSEKGSDSQGRVLLGVQNFFVFLCDHLAGQERVNTTGLRPPSFPGQEPGFSKLEFGRKGPQPPLMMQGALWAHTNTCCASGTRGLIYMAGRGGHRTHPHHNLGP